MNLKNLTAAFTRHKTPLAVAGAGLVVVLAMMTRRGTGEAASSSETAAPAGSSSSTPGGYSAGGQGYADTIATDVYNTLQPQIEAIRDLRNQIPVAGEEEPANPWVGTWLENETSDRRLAIANEYRSVLGRAPDKIGRKEINFWDGTGKSLDDIRAGILSSNEAKTTTR